MFGTITSLKCFSVILTLHLIPGKITIPTVYNDYILKTLNLANFQDHEKWARGSGSHKKI